MNDHSDYVPFDDGRGPQDDHFLPDEEWWWKDIEPMSAEEVEAIEAEYPASEPEATTDYQLPQYMEDLLNEAGTHCPNCGQCVDDDYGWIRSNDVEDGEDPEDDGFEYDIVCPECHNLGGNRNDDGVTPCPVCYRP